MDETCSLVYRLEERYLDDEELPMDEDVIITNICSSPCKSGCLELIVLNHMNISYIGDVSRFKNLVSHVIEADLAWNDLSDWNMVSTMLAQLPLLRTLNLSHNPLKQDEENINLPIMPRLKMLVLNGTHLPFKILKQICEKVPQLVELHISENNLSLSDDDDSTLHSSVSTVHMNRCGLEQWPDVAKVLRRFPQRKTVFLYDNPIKVVRHETPPSGLDTLQCINISKTDLVDWESIEHLNMLPGLNDLRIMNVPVLDSHSEDERHHLIVGRLPNLLALNGSVITPDIRETAERFFIRYYQDLDDKPIHYETLVNKHGQLERLVKVDLTPKNCCWVNVVCEETNYSQRLNINLQKTVGQLMKSLEKEVGIKYSRMRMMLQNLDPYVMELQYHNRSLFSVRIEDNDTLIIKSKIVNTRRRTNIRSPVQSQ